LTNIVDLMNEASSMLNMIWCRKHRWVGHVLRYDNLLHDIIEVKMLDKATLGRKRIELFRVGKFLPAPV